MNRFCHISDSASRAPFGRLSCEKTRASLTTLRNAAGKGNKNIALTEIDVVTPVENDRSAGLESDVGQPDGFDNLSILPQEPRRSRCILSNSKRRASRLETIKKQAAEQFFGAFSGCTDEEWFTNMWLARMTRSEPAGHPAGGGSHGCCKTSQRSSAERGRSL